MRRHEDLPQDEMEGHLRCRTDSEENVASYKNGDGLSSGADDAPDDPNHASSDEEVSPAEYVRQSTERSEEDGQRRVVHERYPRVPGIRANICIDLREDGCGVTLIAVMVSCYTGVLETVRHTKLATAAHSPNPVAIIDPTKKRL